MSQSGPTSSGGGSVANDIELLTGNSGGAVGPDGSFNVDILGDNATGINIVGTPPSNLLTVFGIPSTTTQVGVTELSTDAEAIAVSSTTVVVTPSNVAAIASQPPNWGTTTPATGTFSDLTSTQETTTAGETWALSSVDDTDSPYDPSSNENYLSCDVSSGTLTIRLPNSPNTGKVYTVKDSGGDANTNNITVTTVGGVVTLDGATTVTMNINYEALRFIFNGSGYEVF